MWKTGAKQAVTLEQAKWIHLQATVVCKQLTSTTHSNHNSLLNHDINCCKMRITITSSQSGPALKQTSRLSWWSMCSSRTMVARQCRVSLTDSQAYLSTIPWAHCALFQVVLVWGCQQVLFYQGELESDDSSTWINGERSTRVPRIRNLAASACFCYSENRKESTQMVAFTAINRRVAVVHKGSDC